MADAFTFELVSPEKLVFSGEATSVSAPGAEGYFTVMPNHAPFMSTLKPGTVEAKLADGTELKVLVLGGLADVSPSGFTLLAEFAAPVADVTAETLDSAIEAAESAAEKAVGDDAKQATEAKLAQIKDAKAELGL